MTTPKPADPVAHWDGCWQAPGHHQCAIVLVRHLSAQCIELTNERDRIAEDCQADAYTKRIMEMSDEEILRLTPPEEVDQAVEQGKRIFAEVQLKVFKEEQRKAAASCELCDHELAKECRYCHLAGEPNPESYTREQLIHALREAGMT